MIEPVKTTILNPTLSDLLDALDGHPNCNFRELLQSPSGLGEERTRLQMKRINKGDSVEGKSTRRKSKFKTEFEEKSERVSLVMDNRHLTVMEIEISPHELVIRLEEERLEEAPPAGPIKPR